SRSRRAKLFRQAGELAFLEQKLPASGYFLEKSLAEENASATRQRWRAVRAEYYRSIKKEMPPESERATTDETLEASAEELTIYNRMRDATRTGDYVSAVEDGIRLIKDYPGGKRAQL